MGTGAVRVGVIGKALSDSLSDLGSVPPSPIVDKQVELAASLHNTLNDLHCLLHHTRVQHPFNHNVEGMGGCIGLIIGFSSRRDQPDR